MRLFSTHFIYMLIGTTLCAVSFYSYAEPISVTVGEYIAEGGWGQLTITKSNKQLHFSISAVGANAHICDLEGKIKDNQSTPDNDMGDQSCVIHFRPQGSSIKVESEKYEACSIYCGARATFEGVYLKPAVGCADKEREHTHRQFKMLYDKKNYKAAAATLTPLLTQCEKTLGWMETGEIRNDLAITQYHLKQFAECQKTLEPLQNNVGQMEEKLPQTEQGLKELLPPSDFDAYLPIAKATWHNSKLCSQPTKR
jgi:hypothetical protein